MYRMYLDVVVLMYLPNYNMSLMSNQDHATDALVEIQES